MEQIHCHNDYNITLNPEALLGRRTDIGRVKLYTAPYGTPFVASWSGNEFINCARSGYDSITVFLDCSKLLPGPLRATVEGNLPDEEQPDGYLHLCAHLDTGITLTDNDTGGNVTVGPSVPTPPGGSCQCEELSSAEIDKLFSY